MKGLHRTSMPLVCARGSMLVLVPHTHYCMECMWFKQHDWNSFHFDNSKTQQYTWWPFSHSFHWPFKTRSRSLNGLVCHLVKQFASDKKHRVCNAPFCSALYTTRLPPLTHTNTHKHARSLSHTHTHTHTYAHTHTRRHLDCVNTYVM